MSAHLSSPAAARFVGATHTALCEEDFFMQNYFKLKEHGTTVRTEIMAGLTTFMTMAYVLAVQPSAIVGFG
jgi:hypothetical protein